MNNRTLYLLPNLLDEELLNWESFLPANIAAIVQGLSGLIAESEKSARRYLRRFLSHEQLVQMPLLLLNEHTKDNELDGLLAKIKTGERWGLVSDAGLPCLADPGAPLVRRAHMRQIEVIPIAGPSSLIFALLLSGLNGQRFAFHGYLPRELPALKDALLRIEKRSSEESSTQIWIEAPYRSAKIAASALEVLKSTTLLCIALSLTTSRQRIKTQTINDWRKTPWEIAKEPAVFLLGSFL